MRRERQVVDKEVVAVDWLNSEKAVPAAQVKADWHLHLFVCHAHRLSNSIILSKRATKLLVMLDSAIIPVFWVAGWEQFSCTFLYMAL